MINNKIELHSDELQDIIGRIPTRIERFGIIVMLCIIVIIIIGSFFFRYPDTLEAQVVVTNSTPPIDIVAKTAGNLDVINVRNKARVKAGDILAVVHNNANFEDVLRLKKLIESWSMGETGIEKLSVAISSKKENYGDLQNYYINMCNAMKNLLIFQEKKYYQQKIEISTAKQELRHVMENKGHEYHYLQEEQEKIEKEKYFRDTLLHNAGLLSKEAYERSRYSYLQSCHGQIERELEENQHVLNKLNDKENLLDLENASYQQKHQYEQEFLTATKELLSAIDRWEEMYIMRSPADGTINLAGAWGINQYVSSGQIIFIVVPLKLAQPIGKAVLPAIGAGKIKKGQRVIVSINNYPDEEFGNLIGSVSAISSTATSEGNYIVDISFPNGLTTIYKRELPSSQQLIGAAKIIVKKRRLCDLFIQPIMKILKNQDVLDD